MSGPENALKVQILEVAKLLGWRTAHFRPARTANSWRTPVEGDGTGFPDLVLVRERVVFAELKSARGRMSGDQTAWVDALAGAGAEVYVWYPQHWDDIVATLRRTDDHR